MNGAPDPPRPVCSWLAVIDLQQIFADPRSPWACPDFDAVLEPVARLVDAFGDRAIFTRFLAPAEPVGAWRAYYAQWAFARQPAQAPLYALVPRFAEHTGATVDECTFGKWGPGLSDRIGSDDRLVVCGVSTDCCVLSTVLAAADAGVEVLVVADACAGASAADHDRALDAMSLYGPFVRIVTVDEALAAAHPVVDAGQPGPEPISVGPV